MDLQSILNGVTESIGSLCPILGTVNFKRRISDNGNNFSPFKSIFLRGLVSIVVAMVLGMVSAGITVYISLPVVVEKINAVNYRVEKLENRFNSMTDDYYRNNNH